MSILTTVLATVGLIVLLALIAVGFFALLFSVVKALNEDATPRHH